MYYDEQTKTWFESELHAYMYNATGTTWAADAFTDEIFEAGAVSVDFSGYVDGDDYDRMEEQSGDYMNACGLLLDALTELLDGRTTCAGRNALRARLQDRLPARVLEDGGWRLQTILAPEQATRKTRNTLEELPFC